MLTQIATAVVTDPRKYLTAIHGIEGVGKTSFGQQVPGHYFLITEAGTEGVEVFGHPILSWDGVEKNANGTSQGFVPSCLEILAAKENGFKEQRKIKVIVIDTGEKLYNLCGKHICATRTFVTEGGGRQKFSAIEDVGFGKGYAATTKLLLEKLNYLMLHGLGVMVLFHTRERIVKWAGVKHQHYGLNLSPTAAKDFAAACGAVGHFIIDVEVKRDEENEITEVEQDRYMLWQRSFMKVAKHRLDSFPAQLPLPKNKGYETYLKAFNETVAKLVNAEPGEPD